MDGYAMKRVQQRADQIFGNREFFMQGRQDAIQGELVKLGNDYFARIGDGAYRTTMIQYEDGKRWVIQPNPS